MVRLRSAGLLPGLQSGGATDGSLCLAEARERSRLLSVSEGAVGTRVLPLSFKPVSLMRCSARDD